MPLNRQNTRTFHRALYSGQLETVRLLKREDDQRSGTFRSLTLFDCRWSAIQRTGEPIQREITSGDRRTLHIPVIELHRVKVEYINPLDRFIDAEGRYWEPEAPQGSKIKLFQNHHCVDCVRVDPPDNIVRKVM